MKSEPSATGHILSKDARLLSLAAFRWSCKSSLPAEYVKLHVRVSTCMHMHVFERLCIFVRAHVHAYMSIFVYVRGVEKVCWRVCVGVYLLLCMCVHSVTQLMHARGVVYLYVFAGASTVVYLCICAHAYLNISECFRMSTHEHVQCE